MAIIDYTYTLRYCTSINFHPATPEGILKLFCKISNEEPIISSTTLNLFVVGFPLVAGDHSGHAVLFKNVHILCHAISPLAGWGYSSCCGCWCQPHSLTPFLRLLQQRLLSTTRLNPYVYTALVREIQPPRIIKGGRKSQDTSCLSLSHIHTQGHTYTQCSNALCITAILV